LARFRYALPHMNSTTLSCTPGSWLRHVIGLALLAAGGFESLVLASERRSTAELIAAPDPGWAQFRGPRRDGISNERGLLQSWPEGGPKQLWSVGGLGRGFSSPIISNGRLFITGDHEGELHLFAFDLAGRELWRTKNGMAWSRDYPGARSSVAYSDGRVYHQNAHGRLACFEAATGRELWAVSLLERFDGGNITWGLSECPLVDEKAVYATAGGSKALVVAFDKRTGELLWQSESLRAADGDRAVENASYVSPILVKFAGKRLLIGCSLKHLYCVDADTGKLQWTVPRPTRYGVLAMMPVLVGDAVFITATHGPPGQLYRLIAPEQPGGLVGVAPDWTTELDTCQGGVVLVDGKLYGSYYPGRKGWAALDAATGEVLYEETSFVKGAILAADQRLYALSEDGWMRLLEPRADRFEVKGQFRLAPARNDAWAHPVIHEGRMYLRYHEELRCYDVRVGE
jgi:outer membrane protein assembly factor BamB